MANKEVSVTKAGLLSLGIVLVLGKLFGHAQISWWLALAPFYAPFVVGAGLLATVIVLILVLAFIAAVLDI